jgi:thioredoxin-related protein
VIDNGCKWALWLIGAVLSATALAGLPPVEVKRATDLALEGRQAERACVPLMLEFSADHCEYCTLLEEEILKPLLRNDAYRRRVLMRKLVLDSGFSVRDFSGDPVSASALAEDYGVFVTPTLLFLDSQGRELAERMVGVTTLEYYGWYLDQALDASQRELRRLPHCP